MTEEEILEQFRLIFEDCKQDGDGYRCISLLQETCRGILPTARTNLVSVLRQWLQEGWGVKTFYAIEIARNLQLVELRSDTISVMSEWLKTARQPRLGLAISEIGRAGLFELRPDLEAARDLLLAESVAPELTKHEKSWRQIVAGQIQDLLGKLERSPGTQ